MSNINKLLVIYFVFLGTNMLNALIVGSKSNVAAQAEVVFPVTDNNNTMLGFSVFEEGFSLQNALTACTYDGLMYVQDEVNLNGGTLYLLQDLVLANTTTFISGGTIVGNNHAVKLPPQQETFFLPTLGTVVAELMLVDSVATGKGALSTSWSPDNQYVALGSYFTSNSGLDIYSFDGQSLNFAEGINLLSGTYTIHWHPTHNYIAVALLSVAGDEVLVYSFNPNTSTATLVDSVDVNQAFYSVRWHPSGDYLFLGSGSSAGDDIYAYSFSTTTQSLSFVDSVEISPNQGVYLDNIRFSQNGDYFVAGGMSGTLIFSFDGVNLTQLQYEATGYNYAVDWHPTKNLITVGTSSQGLRLYSFDPGTNNLSLEISESPAETQSIFRTEWSPDGNYLMTGALAGNNSRIQLYSLDSTTSLLNRIQSIAIGQNVYAASWSHNSNYLSVSLSNRDFQVYSFLGQSSDIIIDNAMLELNSPVALKRPMTARGITKVTGRGHRLSLADENAKLLIDNHAHLILENIILTDITSEKLGFKGNDSSLLLKNCTLLFDDDYTFSLGSFSCKEQVVFKGGKNIRLESVQSNTIYNDAQFRLSNGMVLSYAPVNDARKNIYLEQGAAIIMEDATALHTTTTGLIIDQGALIIDGNVTFSSEGVAQSESLMFSSQVTILLQGSSELIMHGNIIYD